MSDSGPGEVAKRSGEPIAERVPEAPPAAPATTRRRPTLEERLLAQFFEFDFFQAVRILERLEPGRHGVGQDFFPQQECVRFRSHPSLNFPPSSIAGFKGRQQTDRGSKPPEMSIAFFGLTGPSGTLPRFYTEMLIDRLRHKDRTLHDFLDLFHHRLTSLFYRAWQKYRFWLRFEQAEALAADYRDSPDRYRSFLTDVRPQIDRFSQCMLDVAGMGQPSLRYAATVAHEVKHRTTIADDTFRYFAGLLSNDRRGASGLEQILEAYFNVTVEIRQCVGQWLMLDREDQSHLEDESRTMVGENAVVGERFFDLQGRFRVRVGPVTYRKYLEFLPVGPHFRPLADLARLYARSEFDIDLQLILRHDEVPTTCLSGDALEGPRLGWNTWIYCEKFSADRDDAVLLLESSAEALAV